MDFADVSAGGGDVLDNFDFDSFLNTDKIGMGFHFAEFDGGPEAGVSGAQRHRPKLSLDTNIAQQRGQNRSYVYVLPPSTTCATMSPCRKRRAVSPPTRTGEVCESSVEVTELPTDSDNNEISTDGLLGVEALLQRWFDASATAVILRSSDS
jgi:hypothetical protein